MSREGRPRWGVLQSFVIGRQNNPMMKRVRLIQTPWFGIYLHFIYREDLDPVPHDHPWNFHRAVLRGGYREQHFENPDRSTSYGDRWIRPWRPGRKFWLPFPTHQAHRITYVLPGTISLVVVGPKVRIWGFWIPGERWVDYRDALGLRPNEGVSG